MLLVANDDDGGVVDTRASRLDQTCHLFASKKCILEIKTVLGLGLSGRGVGRAMGNLRRNVKR